MCETTFVFPRMHYFAFISNLFFLFSFFLFICCFVSNFLSSSCNFSWSALILTPLTFEFLYCVQKCPPHSSLAFPGHLGICWTLQVPASVEYHWQLSCMWHFMVCFNLLCYPLTIYLSMLWPTFSVANFPTSILHENLWKVFWKSKQIIVSISSLSASVLNS